MTSSEFESGHGPRTEIPNEIRGWNWGAFLLHWIWGLFNNTFVALLSLIPGLGLIMMIVLGIKGNEWAWCNKKWDSIEHFKQTQRRWAIGALLCWVLVFFFVAAGVGVTLFAVQKTLSTSKPYKVALETAKGSPSVAAILGNDIVETGIPNGSINLENNSGKCDLKISLKGSKGEGDLYIKGEKEAGKWTFSMIKFAPRGSDTRIDLLKGMDNSEKTIIDPSQPIKVQ